MATAAVVILAAELSQGVEMLSSGHARTGAGIEFTCSPTCIGRRLQLAVELREGFELYSMVARSPPMSWPWAG